ncbi:MAG TPA: HAMP domain-containing sensor histidine kinase [Polyangiales bacterium]|nr:HAMP domain-containing sensor histidine kinase [Polyangiales bacterium]
MRLTRKFVVAVVLGIMVVLSVSALARVERETEFFDLDARKDAALVGAVIARVMDHEFRTEGEAHALDVFEDVAKRSRHWQIRFVRLEPSATAARKASLPLAELESVKFGHTWSKRIESGQGLLYTYVPVSLLDKRPAAIEIRESLAEERRYTRSSWRNTILSTLGVIALTAIIASVVGMVFVGRPTRALVEKVRRIGTGDLTGPLPAAQKDELGEITSEINAMCERMQEAQLRIAKETEERIAAEEQLRLADRLSTVGKLASGMAHELGTPLNVVSGRAQMIVKGQSVGDEAKEDARIIWEQAKRMTTLMRALLDFARPSPAHREWIDLRAVAQQTTTMLSALARTRDVELVVETGDAARVDADAAQMQQVFTNLIVNAIHAIDGGGQVNITFREVVQRAPGDQGGREGPCLVAEIADTGHGIEPGVLSKIFEPFFTTKQVGEGTGLGLSITHGIVREHGGFITVRSVLGKGTTFSVYLPVGSEHEAEDEVA